MCECISIYISYICIQYYRYRYNILSLKDIYIVCIYHYRYCYLLLYIYIYICIDYNIIYRYFFLILPTLLELLKNKIKKYNTYYKYTSNIIYIYISTNIYIYIQWIYHCHYCLDYALH